MKMLMGMMMLVVSVNMYAACSATTPGECSDSECKGLGKEFAWSTAGDKPNCVKVKAGEPTDKSACETFDASRGAGKDGPKDAPGKDAVKVEGK